MSERNGGGHRGGNGPWGGHHHNNSYIDHDLGNGNDTFGRNGTWWDHDGERGPLRPGRNITLLPEAASFLVATCYLTFLTVVAIVMAARSKTRLRIFAFFITFLGLSIAIIGYLRAIRIVEPQWFWCWNFFGEGLGVAAMAAIIVSVGSGFYPMARRKSLLWMASMAIVCIYAVLAAVNVGFYIHEKIILHPISAKYLVHLRFDIMDEYNATSWDLQRERLLEIASGQIVSGNYSQTALTGVASWKELTSSERDMFARPNFHWYLSHQLLMLFTFTWSCIYLFVPLVRNHRHGPVGRPVDSNTMAVGVWYLATLLTVVCLYGALNIYYVFEPKFSFEQPAQALDLCLRLTVGPIFMMPAPAFLFRFYRQHFKKFRGTGSSGNGSGGRNTDSSNAQHDSRSYQAGSSRNGGISQFQSSRFANSPRGSFDIGRDNNCDDTKDENKGYNSSLANNANPQGRLKLFQSRDRGLSVESSRVLSRDFEYEEQTSTYSEDRPDSFHQYYNNMDSRHPLRDSVTLGDRPERHELDYKSPDIAELPVAHVRSSKNEYPTERPIMDSSLDQASSDRPCSKELTNQQNVLEHDTTSRSSTSTPEPYNTTSTTSPPHIVSNIEGLTGLQRQLAEHRADLLPRVMAVKEYHEDLASADALEMGLKPTSAAYDHDVILKDANSLSVIDNFFDPSSSTKALQTEDNKPRSPVADTTGITSSPLPPTPKLRKPTSSAALNKDSSAKLPKEPKPKDKKILSAFSKAITGNGSKSGHSHNHSNDGTIMRLPNFDFDGDKDGLGSFETNRGATVLVGPATIEELAEASASSFGQSNDGAKMYTYSDPYEDKTGFKKSSQGQDRQVLMQLPKSLSPGTGSYSRIDCRTTPADAKLRGSQSAGSLSMTSSNTMSPSNHKIPPVPKDSRPTISKKSGHQQTASRSSRSKSDTPYRPSAEIIRGPSTELPINAHRSPPLAPAVLPQPAKTSLSPPPRQSWRRSKSFKGNIPPVIAAIDTKLANEDGSTEPTSNSATSVSLTSSSQSSPTVGSFSRESTLENSFLKEAGLSPSPPVPGFYQNGGRGNPLDNPSLSKGTSSSSSSSTVTAPAHRGINRQQRSIDNLASAYYYKRAAELNNGPSSISPSPLSNRSKHSLGTSSSSNSMRDPSSIMLPSSLVSPNSPPSPQLANSGVANYFNRHQTQASISSSPATSPGLSPGSGPIDRPANGRNSPPQDGGVSGSSRTGSLTKQNTMMADDPWTMALINRAQAQSPSASQIPQASVDNYSRPNIVRTASE
ncbi:MAG: hypothetical protein BYD32DRAFT_422603 [Podila humilis]|nr:MAG: hypothetical protein BYD32DRAFT_422603 [Podila humilis]